MENQTEVLNIMLISTTSQGHKKPVDVCYHCYEGLTVAHKFKSRMENQLIKSEDNSSDDLTSDVEHFAGLEQISNDRNNNELGWTSTDVAAKPFVCDTCHRAFRLKGEVEQHIKRHQTKRGQKRCKKCNSKFLCMSHYNNHVC